MIHPAITSTSSLNLLERYKALTHWRQSYHFFPVSHHYYSLSKVDRCSPLLTSIMSDSETETCIKWGEYGARVLIENKKIPHYNIKVDPEKKEVTCWIASEEEKVCESFFTTTSC